MSPGAKPKSNGVHNSARLIEGRKYGIGFFEYMIVIILGVKLNAGFFTIPYDSIIVVGMMVSKTNSTLKI